MKKQKMFLKMITASLVRRRSRMLVALLAIAVGATILNGMVTIYYDVPRQMGAEFRNYGANMIFVSDDSEEGMTMDSVNEATSLIRKDQLVGVAPYRYENVTVNGQPLMAAGTDMEGAKASSPYWKVSGEWPDADGEILVGQSEASHLGLKEGSTLTMVYVPESADPDSTEQFEKEFTVTGFLETGGSEEDYLYISLSDMKALTEEEGTLDVVELSVSASSEELDQYVETIGGFDTGIRPRLIKRVAQSETTVLTKLQALVFLVTAVVLILTMICVATTMTAVVAERRKEIGLRKALGAPNKSIIFEFMGEGLLLGGIGGLIGSGLGYVFAQIISLNVFNSSIAFQPVMIPITVAVSIAVTGLACLLPVRSATDVDPALVLKGE